MYTIENANGSTYYVMREYHNHDNGGNVLLLASYGNKTSASIAVLLVGKPSPQGRL